jgi:hypothetical protein
MRFICLCLIVAMQPLTGFAQREGSAQQGSSAYDLWLVRSKAITVDLIKDSTDLTPSERALLWAELAAKWWRDDPEKARSWMLKPIEIVESVPNKENPEERRQRLTTVRLLLQIVAPLDQKLSARLVVVLTEGADQEAKTGGSNADRLIEAATFMVDSDPKRAAELGALALRVGHPTDISSLLWRLRRKDDKLANAFFAQALAVVRQTLDEDLLNSLSNAVFPESRTPGFYSTTAIATDDMRTELLRVYLAYLQASPITAENRNSRCIAVVSLIAPELVQFDRLLPQKAVIVRQSVNQCKSLSPLADQLADDLTRDQPLNTVDDLLKAADDAQDTKVRTVYQFRAAMLAKQQNDFDQALKILDSMSTESREFLGGSWEAYRWDWAASSALRHLKNGDVFGMRLVLNAVPIALQPFARIAFVDQLPADRNKDTDPTLEFLSEARTGLRRSSVSEAEKSGWYFGLLPLIIQYQPAEATAVLREAVATLNRATLAEDKNTGNHEGSSLSQAQFAKRLPATLLEMDEFVVKEAVSSITSAQGRVLVRLELLSVCLERLRSSKRRSPRT